MTSRVTLRALNNAVASENRIHSDAVAREHGFRGGLVPGVTVYAYMAGLVVDVLGEEWREQGTISAKFIRPVYDGDEIVVTASVVDEDDTDPSAAVSVVNNDGVTCAVATASLPRAPQSPPPDAASYPEAPLPRPRPPASPDALASGTVLGTIAERLVRDPAPAIFAELGPQFDPFLQDRAVDPAHLVRAANAVLAANVKLGPWLHVASEVTHFGLVHEGDRVEVRARVAEEYERKGHRFVALDLVLLAGDDVVVHHVRHTAIYQLAEG